MTTQSSLYPLILDLLRMYDISPVDGVLCQIDFDARDALMHIRINETTIAVAPDGSTEVLG